jgi:alanyl-tRNA synthetase
VNTDRLYYSDCYLASFDAQVVDRIEDGCRIYLDRTAFYPESGGQPHDLGLLGGERIVEVVNEADRIAHRIAAPIQADFVACEINWPRRYDHMQQHTGQHLLSAVFVQLFGIHTLSFHMGAELSTIDLHTKALTDSQIDQAEDRANAIVREARPVHIGFQEAEEARDLRKPTERSGTLRIVEIENYDRSACGGTHVRSTAELGPIQVRKLEKIRGNIRIEFVCGIRAIRRAKQDFHIASEISKSGAVAIDNVPEYVSSLRVRLSAAEKELQKLALEMARRDADSLYDSTIPGSDGLRRVFLRVAVIDETVRAKVQAFTQHGKAIAIVIGTDPVGIVLAASPDSGVNAGTVLKQALSKVGARGGGSATIAQGSLPDQTVADSLRAALEISCGSAT